MVSGKLEITIPEEVHVAGRPNIIRIIIHNPFDSPVEILDVRAPKSSQIRRLKKKSSEDQPSQESRPLSLGLNSILGGFSSALITEVTFGGIRAEFPRSGKTLNISAEPKSDVTINEDLTNFFEINIRAEEEARVVLTQGDREALESKDQESLEEDQPQIIQPRCERVAYVTILTNGWLFFTPQRVSLSTEIFYKIENLEKTQVINSYFDVKPPLGSMIFGAIVGGGLGSSARMLQGDGFLSFEQTAVRMGAAITMSLIAAIALARKSGTQGFITVEDFFGAFVIGSLIGYGGSEYFENALLPVEPNKLN